MDFPWDEEIAGLLRELSQVQDELLQLLVEKQHRLAEGDAARLAATEPRGEELVQRLEACHARRQALLAQAGRDGLPHESLQALASALPSPARADLGPQLKQAKARGRLLAHQSLTNWVIAQRTLIHVAQMLEIIATGGRLCPTYAEGPESRPSGALVDQAV
jgi:hypothetical protein